MLGFGFSDKPVSEFNVLEIDEKIKRHFVYSSTRLYREMISLFLFP